MPMSDVFPRKSVPAKIATRCKAMITTATAINVFLRNSLVGFLSLTFYVLDNRKSRSRRLRSMASPDSLFRAIPERAKSTFSTMLTGPLGSVRTVYDSEQIKRRDIKMNCAIGSRLQETPYKDARSRESIDRGKLRQKTMFQFQRSLGQSKTAS